MNDIKYYGPGSHDYDMQYMTFEEFVESEREIPEND